MPLAFWLQSDAKQLNSSAICAELAVGSGRNESRRGYRDRVQPEASAQRVRDVISLSDE